MEDTDNGDEYVVVDHSPFRFGRRPDNDAQILRSDISGLHAIIRQEADRWVLCDNRSTNGTFLNGRKVQTPTAINLGDMLQFATKTFQVVADVETQSRDSCTRIIADSSLIKGKMDLLSVIEQQRTFPHFQPIFDLQSDRTVGWEALGRAASSNGPMGTGLMFWLANQNGLESKLSRHFRDSARQCAECRHCWPQERGAYMFINLHPSEIEDPDFLDSLHELSRSEMRRWYRIVIEMPESWVCKPQEMAGLVKEIRKRGLLVAYDDFGRGQSRLPDLISMPPDFLKLDRDLVAGLGANKVQRSLVLAIMETCRELKVITLAEGIETYEELQACVDMGINLGQGYLLERPKTAYELFSTDTATLPPTCLFQRLNLLPKPNGELKGTFDGKLVLSAAHLD